MNTRLTIRNCLLLGCLVAGGCDQPQPTPKRSQVAPEPTIESTNQGVADPATTTPAKVDDAEQPVSVDRKSEPVSAAISVSGEMWRPGDQLALSVEFDIAAGYEIHSVDTAPPMIATALNFNLPTGFEIEGDRIDPESVRSLSPDGHPVYFGKVTFTQQIRVGDVKVGDYQLGVSVKYQACNSHSCLRPVTKCLSQQITVR